MFFPHTYCIACTILKSLVFSVRQTGSVFCPWKFSHVKSWPARYLSISGVDADAWHDAAYTTTSSIKLTNQLSVPQRGHGPTQRLAVLLMNITTNTHTPTHECSLNQPETTTTPSGPCFNLSLTREVWPTCRRDGVKQQRQRGRVCVWGLCEPGWAGGGEERK